MEHRHREATPSCVVSNSSLFDSSLFHLVGDNFLNIAGSGLFGDEDEQGKELAPKKSKIFVSL